jgi:uncharacterized protein (DUF1800 family)
MNDLAVQDSVLAVEPPAISTTPSKAPSPLAMASAAALASAVLAACGGAGGETSPSPPPGPPPSPPPGPPPTSEQASRFLLQAQFSASDADIAAVQSQGYAAWLDAQINAPASTTAWEWLMSQGYNTDTFKNTQPPADYMAWNQLLSSTDAVRKRVALALSEFFVVSTNNVPVQSRFFGMAHYWDVLAAGAFGNFRTLLEEVTLNPIMGVYLNTRGNQKANTATGRAPDENYAREVLQLFSIGLYELNQDGTNKPGANGQPIETYTQEIITSLAQVFTGYDFDTTGATAITNPLQLKNRMVLKPALHETAAATFLGTTIAAGTEGLKALDIALDTIFNHPNVGPFFSKQLIQRLVVSNPSPAYVLRVANVFNNDGTGVRGNLKAVIKAVLLDTEARDGSPLGQPSWGKQRELILRFVQWARTFGATSPSGRWIVPDLTDVAKRLGQSPLRSGSVFNFFRPGYVPPNTVLAAQGLTAPEFQLTNESSVAGYLNFMQGCIKDGVNPANGGLAAPAYTQELALANDPAALVNRLNLLLCAGQLSVTTQATVRDAITTISATDNAGALNRVQAAVLLTMASPEYLIQK